MKTIKTALIVSTLAMLGGCVSVPADPGYYYAPQAYYVPAPAYYYPPVYYGPAFSFRFSSGGRGFHHR